MPSGLSTILVLVGRRAFYQNFPVNSSFYSPTTEKMGIAFLFLIREYIFKLAAAKENSSSPPHQHTGTSAQDKPIALVLQRLQHIWCFSSHQNKHFIKSLFYRTLVFKEKCIQLQSFVAILASVLKMPPPPIDTLPPGKKQKLPGDTGACVVPGPGTEGWAAPGSHWNITHLSQARYCPHIPHRGKNKRHKPRIFI